MKYQGEIDLRRDTEWQLAWRSSKAAESGPM
jgi:hypothetical protein